MNTLEALTCAGIGLATHHHALYPMLVGRLGLSEKTPRSAVADEQPVRITLVMPAHNEAGLIGAKINNLASLEFPRDRLRLLIACDGCTDDSLNEVQVALKQHPDLQADVMTWPENIGKIETLNRLMAEVHSEVVVFTDVSAMLPHDALIKFAAWFQDPAIGAVGAGYDPASSAGDGERSYWRYQTAIKRGESRLGGLLGAHGACYAVRAKLFEQLASDTINDDFIIPVGIATKGSRTVYDPSIRVREAAQDVHGQNARRRRRIGAGNLQQVLRCAAALDPRRPGLAFAFFSGKVLRALMPAILALTFAGSLVLSGNSQVFALLAAFQVVALGLATLGTVRPGLFGVADKAAFLISGYFQAGIGALGYIVGHASVSGPVGDQGGQIIYTGPVARSAKRAADIAAALLGILFIAPLLPFIALAIRLESPGPVFFRQMRVGRALHDRTELFMMIKFRSMRQDAEAATGAVWAQKRDPRITRVGNFLRKTRLDELPQLINVLRGDMSLVGPRPERPGFYQKLESAIPFYSERTFGLRPGITGLAQVCQGYDETIEDVRSKVMYDHAYAASISRLGDWALTDLTIACRTVGVMVLGRGQ